MRRGESWGRYPSARQQWRPVEWAHEVLPRGEKERWVLPYGQGRSYGDSCLNHGGVLLSTQHLNRFLAFDRTQGVLRCEAGATLDQILRLIVPQGWFLPVTPGTRFVSIGGAIANDVHGKNHHRAGTFGCHVRSLALVRSDGQRIECGPDHNSDWFAATVGGLGLTGLIVSAEIQLKPIASLGIVMESQRFRDLNEFMALSVEAEQDDEYSVAWVDCLASGKRLGRGLFMRGNHAPPSAQGPSPRAPRPGLSVPLDAPSLLLNRISMRAFNTLYYHRHPSGVRRRCVHYEPFFYPLDAIRNWNRIYGHRGFLQYQCVVPFTDGTRTIAALLERIARSGRGSFLSVLKTFGNVHSPGLLSFPRPGITLALDFPFRGPATLALLDELDIITRDAGGAVYPAKDARMSAASFQAFYPAWQHFARYVDPHFSSSFWRRVTRHAVERTYEEDSDRWRHLRDRTGNRQAVRS